MPPTLLLRLIHLFGAVLAGGKVGWEEPTGRGWPSQGLCWVGPSPIACLYSHLQENGQTAVSAGSVQGLLGVVQGWGRGPAQDSRLVPLALEALVGTVHVLHASHTPPRGPELRALLEGYFRVLNADWPSGPSPGPEEALVTLRVSMLGGYGLPGSWGSCPRSERPK